MLSQNPELTFPALVQDARKGRDAFPGRTVGKIFPFFLIPSGNLPGSRPEDDRGGKAESGVGLSDSLVRPGSEMHCTGKPVQSGYLCTGRKKMHSHGSPWLLFDSCVSFWKEAGKRMDLRIRFTVFPAFWGEGFPKAIQEQMGAGHMPNSFRSMTSTSSAE
jgi:hypothetical protein